MTFKLQKHFYLFKMVGVQHKLSINNEFIEVLLILYMKESGYITQIMTVYECNGTNILIQ